MLEAKDITVFFENALAVNNLSLHVAKGEIVAVLGSNSAGKTTLLNTLSGVILDIKLKEERRGGERITIFGQVYFEGEDVTWVSPWDRARKGLVLCRERHPIFPQSSVEENLKIAACMRKDRITKKELDFVYSIFPRLVDIRKRKAGLCSGGEQQMLAIGMALMCKPKLLLLDEPLLGLAPALQLELIKAMLSIRAEGLTILVAEQYARPLLPVVDRAYVIENGTLVVAGTGKELMENPEVRYAYFGI